MVLDQYMGFEQGGSRNNDLVGRIGAVAIMRPRVL